MKKFTTLVLLSLLSTACIIAQQVPAQLITTGFNAGPVAKYPHATLPAAGQGATPGSRATASFYLDYATADYYYGQTLAANAYYAEWNLNKANDVQYVQNSVYNAQDNRTLQWAGVLFDTIYDYTNGGTYPRLATQLTVDTIFVDYRHINQSGTRDSLTISLYNAINYNFNTGVFSGTPLFTRVITTTSTLTQGVANGNGTYKLAVPVFNGATPGFQLATGAYFAVRVDYAGSKLDSFMLTGYYHEECAAACLAGQSAFYGQTIQYLNFINTFNGDTTDLSGGGYLQADCNGSSSYDPDQCEAYYLQNWGISAKVTANVTSYLVSQPTTVNTCSGGFFDSGDVGGTYLDNEDYTKTFTSANGAQLKFDFSMFETEAGYDFLTVYDGPTTAATVIGTYDGYLAPFSVTSTGNSLTFQFTSDVSNTGAGFAANISCTGTPATDYLISQAGTVTTCSGNFYDSGASGSNYSNNENYTKTFTSSTPGQQIRFTFSSFSVEGANDFLYIYDGTSTSSPLIGTYSNVFGPGTVTSTSGSLTFRFTSNGSSTFPGWAANISCVPSTSTTYLMYQSATVTACSGTFYDSGNSLGYYSSNENLTKTFNSASAGQQVRVTFSAFNTEAGNDILYVYDGPSTASTLIASYSGTSIPAAVTSTGGSLTFRFSSNSSFVQPGWEAAVSCVTPGSTCTPDPNVTQPGISPASDNIPCIVQNVPYSTTLTFKNYTVVATPFGTFTMDSLRIDSLTNMPCGIGWVTNKSPQNVYGSGELGCIQLSGTTTDPVGQYQMGIWGFAWLQGIGGVPVTGNNVGLRVDLRVKATTGSTCNPVDTFNQGLVANRTCTAVALTVNAGNDVTICAGSSTTLSASASGGTGSYTYTWSPNTNLSCTACQTTSANPTITRTYTVTVSDGVNTATDQVIVNVQNAVVPNVTITSSPSPACANQSVTYSATVTNGGTPSYLWQVNGSNVATTASYTGSNTSGSTVRLIITSTATCASPVNDTSNVITVTTCATPLSVNAGSDVSICPGSSTALSASASGGTGNYTYTWSPNTNLSCTACQTTSANPSITRTYTVTVSDGVNTATDQVTVTLLNTVIPTATISSNPSPACGGQSATYTAVVTNGGTSPAYLWQVNGSNVATTSSYTGTNGAGSTVRLIFTSNANCASPAIDTSNILTVSNCSGQLSVTAGNDVAICSGSSTTLSASASGGTGSYTYTWSPNTNLSCTSCQSTTATPNITRTYTVTVSDGVNTATDQVVVTVQNAVTPSVSITSNPSPACNGQSATYSATPTNGGTSPSYQWQVNGTNVGTGSTYTGSHTTGSTVRVILTSNELCLTTARDTSNVVTVQSCTSPLSVDAGADVSICGGSSTVLSATATGGTGNYTYTWSPQTNLSCTACQTTTATPGTTRTYTVTVSDGSTTATDQVTVTVQTAVTPTVTISSNPSPACAGQSVTFTANPVNGGSSPSYQWLVNGSGVAVGSTYSSSSLTAGNTVQAILTASGCVTTQTASSNTITVITCGNNLSVSTSSTDNDICFGESTTISATASGGTGNYTYVWSGNAPCTSCATMNVSPVTTTVYSVTVNDGSTAVSGTVTINVTSIPNASISITSSPSPACANQATTFTANPVNGGSTPSYTWYVNNVMASPGTSYSSSTLAAGTSVYATMLSSLACAQQVTSNTVFVSSCSGPLTVFTSDDDTICSGNSTTITAQGDGGTGNYTYTWTPSTGLSANNVANPVASPTVTTTYTVSVNDGVNTASGTVVVRVNSSHFADAGTGGTICPGGSVTLTATGGGTYQWSPSTGLSCTACPSPVASPTATTIYSVEVTSNGCSDIDEVTVTVNSTATASVTIDAGVDSVCAGTFVTFTATPVNGGNATYQWQVNNQNVAGNGNTLPTGTLLVGNVVTVIMTSSLNCVTNATVTSNAIGVVSCTGIDEPVWAQNLQVYPNPTSDRLFIVLNGNGGEQVQMELFTVQGQRVWTENAKDAINTSIAVDKLAGGVYILKLTGTKGSVARKIVIE